MIKEFFLNPSIWIGLLTLILLEIILGIDNIVFISILSKKLPQKKSKRNQAYVISLLFTFFIRLGLLLLTSWLITFTRPIFGIGKFQFSIKNIMFIFGGLFLFFKAITELQKQFKNTNEISEKKRKKNYDNFWYVIFQIIIFDSLFSIDAIITTIGMVNNFIVMIISTIISIPIIISFSKILTDFINRHYTIIILCLSFLLILGLNLIIEGFEIHISKSYIYISIGFSIFVEFLNHIFRKKNIDKQLVLRNKFSIKKNFYLKDEIKIYKNFQHIFNKKNKFKTSFLIYKDKKCKRKKSTFMFKTLKNIMTPKNKIVWLDINKPIDKYYEILIKEKYNVVPVCNGEIDQLIGILTIQDVIKMKMCGEKIEKYISLNPILIFPEKLNIFVYLNEFFIKVGMSTQMIFISNEKGKIQGLITPLDILKIINNYTVPEKSIENKK